MKLENRRIGAGLRGRGGVGRFLCVQGLLVVALCLELPAATYCVSLDGSDANPGTPTLPWRTIQKAANTAAAGDTVQVAAGDYGEEVTTAKHGASGAYITFDGQNAAFTTRFIIRNRFTRLINFGFRGIAPDPRRFGTKFVVHFFNGGHDSVVSNCFVDAGFAWNATNSSYVGGIGWDMGSGGPFDSDSSSRCLVVANTITRVKGYQGIRAYGRDNQFLMNVCTNLSDVDCMRIFGINNVFRWNRFADIRDAPDCGNHMDMFQTFGSQGHVSSNIWIDSNIFRDAPADAQVCQLEAYTNAHVRDWLISNNQFINLALGGHILMPRVRWVHNLFYNVNNVAHVLNFCYYDDASAGGQATDCEVVNNVFLACGDTRSMVGWYMFTGYPAGGVSVLTDYNYVAKDGFLPVDSALVRSTFKWQEDHGINGGDPGFLSVSGNDFRLRADSPLIDRGRTVAGLANDFAGSPRPSGLGWDIGAFEYASLAGVPPKAPTRFRAVP